jgi:sulfide:quinone oxidoreductase
MISLSTKVRRSFAGLNFKRKPLKRDLEHYEVVIAGCNMGAILGRHFDHVTHGHHPTMTILKDSIN